MNLFLDVAAVKRTLFSNVSELQQDGGDWECEVRAKDGTGTKDNYASFIYIADFVNARAKKNFSVIVKVMPENMQMREIQNSSYQFFNEDVIFQRVLPLLVKHSGLRDKSAVSSLVPKCYFASHVPETAMIVLENLTVEGYKLGDLNLDYEHCKLAMETLGRYHALSYELKHVNEEVFQKQVVGAIKEARFNETYRSRFNQVFFQYLSTDPVNHILNSQEPELITFRTKHSDFLKRLVESLQNPVNVIESIMIPEDPLAVLTHGDFNRNNILFKYDNLGHPIEVKLIDFQTVRYANAAADFVFFIFFNMSADLRREKLDDLLQCYQKVVVDSLEEATGLSRERLESVYSVQAFKDDFTRCAVYGYIISAMFIHFMLATSEELEVLEREWMRELGAECPPEGYLRALADLGGEDALRRSVSIIKDMAELECNVGGW